MRRLGKSRQNPAFAAQKVHFVEANKICPISEDPVMSVGRICVREVFLAETDESVSAAAKRMKEQNVGTLVVLDERTAPVGILTDRDVAIRIVGDQRSVTTAVREVMSPLPDTIEENASIETALEMMRSGRHRRLPVVDYSGRLVGIISLDDILELLAEEFRSIGQLLEQN